MIQKWYVQNLALESIETEIYINSLIFCGFETIILEILNRQRPFDNLFNLSFLLDTCRKLDLNNFVGIRLFINPSIYKKLFKFINTYQIFTK